MMNNTLIIGLVVFMTLLAGTFVGVKARDCLPKHHLTDEAKNLVSVSMAVVATVSALVLGLLISTANTSFTRLGGEVTGPIGANSPAGSRTSPIRSGGGNRAQNARTVRGAQGGRSVPVRLGNLETYELLQRVQEMLLTLKPANPRDQWWLDQSMAISSKIGDTRQGTPKAFVALLVVWLALLFASFGLFAPRSPTAAVTLALCALAVAGAVAMFLELEHGFGGNVRISPEPMRKAVKTLKAEPSNQN